MAYRVTDNIMVFDTRQNLDKIENLLSLAQKRSDVSEMSQVNAFIIEAGLATEKEYLLEKENYEKLDPEEKRFHPGQAGFTFKRVTENGNEMLRIKAVSKWIPAPICRLINKLFPEALYECDRFDEGRYFDEEELSYEGDWFTNDKDGKVFPRYRLYKPIDRPDEENRPYYGTMVFGAQTEDDFAGKLALLIGDGSKERFLKENDMYELEFEYWSYI